MSALAAPPPLPLVAVDLPIPGGRLRRFPTGLIEIVYDGLPPFPSWPEDTPFHRELAVTVAAGDLFEANLQHELAHAVLISEWLGLPHSPTLHVAAQKAAGIRQDWWSWWWQEEQVVLGVQRFAATLGIDLVLLSAEVSCPTCGARR